MATGTLFVISAPSGTGKTSLTTEALKRLEGRVDICRHLTCTTRTPRDGEVDGRDYVFVSKDEFAQKRTAGFFLETSEYNNHWYGSPNSVAEQLELGKSVIAITDRPGLRNFKQAIPGAVLIWVSPPNFESLKQRMIGRGTESALQVEKRLGIAQQEMDEERKQPLAKYHLVNDDFDKAVVELMRIITDEAVAQ